MFGRDDGARGFVFDLGEVELVESSSDARVEEASGARYVASVGFAYHLPTMSGL